VAITQVNLGDVTRRMGEYGLARKFLGAAAATFRAYGRQDGLFHALHNLAGVEIDAGEWLDAETRLWALLARPSALPVVAGQALEGARARALVLTDLACLCLRRGDAGQARSYAGQAAELWREVGHGPNLHVARALLASAGYLDLDDWLELAEAGEAGLAGSENPHHMAWLFWHRGLCAAGHPARARQAIRLGVESLLEQVTRLSDTRHRRCFLTTWLASETLQAWRTAVMEEAGNGPEAAWTGIRLWQAGLGDLAQAFLDYTLDEIEAGRYVPAEADMDTFETAYIDIYTGEKL
jgi:hypothetical protein